MTTKFSIIIPTRNRQQQIISLLESIRQLKGLERFRPEIIVGDNASKDQTWERLQKIAAVYPVSLRAFQVMSPGKCKVLNAAMSLAIGDVFVFVDDDVAVAPNWLAALDDHFRKPSRLAAQGAIRLPERDVADPEIHRLIEKYRTVRPVHFDGSDGELHSLNGANMALRREVFDRVGTFDIRLGPGASGTSEDTELARRIRRAGITIDYIENAVVYHQLDRPRLTDAYFKYMHRQQGASRLIFKRQSVGRIVFDLCRVSIQCSFHWLFGGERKLYRSKGRIFHYLGMLESKWKGQR